LVWLEAGAGIKIEVSPPTADFESEEQTMTRLREELLDRVAHQTATPQLALTAQPVTDDTPVLMLLQPALLQPNGVIISDIPPKWMEIDWADILLEKDH
jgi:hypothetical protein